jgi:hypothetical protein
MKKRRRKYRSYKIDRYRLRNNFASGIFLGILGTLIINRLPDEMKIKVLKAIVEKARAKPIHKKGI